MCDVCTVQPIFDRYMCVHVGPLAHSAWSFFELELWTAKIRQYVRGGGGAQAAAAEPPDFVGTEQDFNIFIWQ